MAVPIRSVYLYNVSPKALVRAYLRKKAWNWFDWNQNFFLNPGDNISHLPLLGQTHDEDVVETLKYLGKYLPDAFVDIGANIGLVSIKVAPSVKHVTCYEVNPLTCKILHANMTLNCTDFVIHEVGLGASNGECTLYVPKKNLGGAFILESNEYDLDQLARKDGYPHYDPRNYLVQKVRIRSCNEAMQELRSIGHKTLLIKIDIEGLDQLIIDEILRVLREYFLTTRIAFVFESHDKKSARNMQSITAQMGYGIYGVAVASAPRMRQPIVRRLLKLLKGEQRQLVFLSLSESESRSDVTNFVCCPPKFVEP